MNINPINRQSKFFSEKEYQYYLDLAHEYMSQMGVTISLIKVDKEQSEVDDLYGEAYSEEITYHPPVEIPAIVKFEDPENRTYVENKGLIQYEEFGNLISYVLLDDLSKINTDITYGDYIGYRVSEDEMVYFEVANAAQKYYQNSNTMFGYKAFWKTIVSVPTNVNFEIE